jgi:hypothetical protein
MAVVFGGEYARALVGDRWPWFMLALNMALYVVVMVIPDRQYARFYTWLNKHGWAPR